MSEYKPTLADKFWLRMGEKFGQRWVAERGPAPNDEWRALINQFSEYQLNLALDNLPKWDYPPTHPVMAAHLRSFSTKQERNGSDFVRDHWRVMVVGELQTIGWLKGYWRYGTTLLQLGEPERGRLLTAMRRLVDEAADTEIRAGHRPPGLLAKVVKDCERVIATLRAPIEDPTVDRHP